MRTLAFALGVLAGGCSIAGLHSESLHHDCSYALPALDATLAAAGLAVGVYVETTADADAEAHGVTDYARTFFILPAVAFAVSAAVGISEVGSCKTRSAVSPPATALR